MKILVLVVVKGDSNLITVGVKSLSPNLFSLRERNKCSNDFNIAERLGWVATVCLKKEPAIRQQPGYSR